MKENLKAVGTGALAICGFIGFIVLAALLIRGGVWLSQRLLPWLGLIGAVLFFLTVLVFAPLALFRRTRRFAGVAILYTSYVFGVNLWLFGLLVTYALWGIIWVVGGLLMVGIGVVPMAMLATLFKGLWSTLGELVLLTVMTFGCRFLGLWLMCKAEEQRTSEFCSIAA